MIDLTDKSKIIDFINNLNDFTDLVIDCRGHYLKSQGLQQRSNFSGSKNADKIICCLLVNLIKTEKNEFTCPINTLAKILNTDNTKVNTRMKRYFREYGIGDFVTTGKTKYNIYKVIDKDGKEIDTEIKPEAHYTFYFSKYFLKLLEDNNIGTNYLDYDRLNKEADSTALLLDTIRNKKTTSVHIHQYISDTTVIDTYIDIEKDFLNNTGTYDKKVNITIKDEEGSTKQTCIDEISNEFTPKQKKDKLQEIFNPKGFHSNDPEEIYEALFNGIITKNDLTIEQKKIVIKEHPGCLARDYRKYR